ncbi:EscU/YscU/HrcU family type III secretion system export apparatus switch protein [Silvibacterium dinghuense]|uniref:EscU/YscU/HrcU family type III secretion system export apparatus switch protein n=1 Tax=Silvibacterium dinghuense TaxID=1560006 RepID=A0A4Q1SFL8_9BACT|nr:EscU/YscU/HrcU family type III secretion system export apparatus switch protein [Silvibacterium dinghuense]RXS95658.1 EscU/YscU/HrcU family type III secretion system export apparatus switch protein [Silvibacterium dinghuense]GGH14751.1 flagellar biosynthesis protein FlhB [Silvibacterium dinghuense]
MSGERTEKASPRRRQKATERGDRVFSRDLVAACGMLATLLALARIAPGWPGTWITDLAHTLAVIASSASPVGNVEMDTAAWVVRLRALMLAPMLPVGILLLTSFSASLFAAAAQVRGISFSVTPLGPHWGRLNPVQGMQGLFSLRGLARLARSLLPAAVLVFFAMRRVYAQAALPLLSSSQLLEMFSGSYNILLDTAWILFAWSAVDYIVEWRSWESRQRMTKEEVREEHKQTEGNPQVRGRIRSLRRQMRRRMLKADVRRATVVITNPTHYAVALSFDFETMEPPRMVAKGRNLIAAQIREEARWAGIPIVENPPLARSLYHSLEPGQGIPYNLYAAVAAILAYLYRQRVEERLREEQAARMRAEEQRAGQRNTPQRRAASRNSESARTEPSPMLPGQASSLPQATDGERQ